MKKAGVEIGNSKKAAKAPFKRPKSISELRRMANSMSQPDPEETSEPVDNAEEEATEMPMKAPKKMPKMKGKMPMKMA